MGTVTQLRSASYDDDGSSGSSREVFSALQREELCRIIRERSFRTGEFTLSSGQKSSLYFNMKPTMMDARGAQLAARAFIDLMAQSDAEYVSGLEMGAVPVIGAMAAVGGMIGHSFKTTFVRKRMKEHGTKEMIEGLGPLDTLKGQKVFVVDDVATSGKSILQAIREVRSVGGIVEFAAALVNRQEGGDSRLEAEGVILKHVFLASEIASGN